MKTAFWVTTCWRDPMKSVRYLLPRANFAVTTSMINTGKFLELLRSYSSRFCLEEVENCGGSSGEVKDGHAPPMSLAKSLACLLDESSASDKRRVRTRMELKRSIEVRIKKRVKAQFSNGKFCDLMDKVIAHPDTLRDSYDIIRLNSNVELASTGDDLSFVSMAQQLASGKFDVKANTLLLHAKSGRKECLVLPKLSLKVIQEAIRVVLEVVYRPHFSKISHGCRSGRGHQSALRFVCREIHNPNWWFTISINKQADNKILSKLISAMEEKIEDVQLFSFINHMFNARVLNLVFGGFPKGQGLPQEGVLSPVLMNIYLDIFDREIFMLCMRYEGLGQDSNGNNVAQCSKLRQWIRRQMKDSGDNNQGQQKNSTDLRISVCRYMDEILISISGSKDVAVSVKSEIINYLNSLYLDVDDQIGVLEVNDNRRGLQFLGTLVRVTAREGDKTRAVHKLKDKVKVFASQKQEIWDAWTLRIGKKWSAYGLKRIKESEIKQLGLSTPMLDHISQFRKEGMKTDHWFKSLLKVWMQDVNAVAEANEEVVLSKYIAEPALPQDLKDSFYNFQKQAKEYVSSETAATIALLHSSSINEVSNPSTGAGITRVEAPISFLTKSLHRYGLINIKGFPKHVSTLVLQDDILIVTWFSGLVRRWLKWYPESENLGEFKPVIVECVRKSCIRTLAAKHRLHESIIEKKFELELAAIPMAEELENEMAPVVTESPIYDDDEALMYGISYSGLCMLSLSGVEVQSHSINCFAVGCSSSPRMYTLHVKERQRFPGWKTGFSTSIHPSLNGRRIGLCSQHVKDLYLGLISLQSIEFGALTK